MREPPVPMLAHLERTLPRGEHWRYEPKLDEFRGLLWHGDGATVQLLSRNVKDLSAWFPEVVQAGTALPSNTLLDGEIVIADDGGCSDFGALQARLGTARRDVARVASQRPAVLLCFDLLTLAGEDLTSSPLNERRRRLEHLVADLHPCLQLVIQTDDRQIAQEWLTILTSVEGVVAKRADGHYVAGRQRSWIKVKRQRTIDCVVIGIAGDEHSPKLVLALTHGDGELHHFGLARPTKHMLSPQLFEVLAQAGPEQHPIQSRWQHAAVPAWCPVPPTAVCEVAYTLLDVRWLRMPARFIRWRPDRSPDDCWLDQLAET